MRTGQKELKGNSIPSLSGTFGIPTRLALNPKMPKEPASPSRSNSLTALWIDYKLERNYGQRTTRNIRKPGRVANSKFSTFNKNCNGLIIECFEIPASAYYQPLPAIRQSAIVNIK